MHILEVYNINTVLIRNFRLHPAHFLNFPLTSQRKTEQRKA